MTPTRRHLLAVTLAAALLPLPALAGPWLTEDGTALSGHDPVAYFTEGAPRPGDPAIALDWDGVRWLFATEANREAFRADPAAFAPQYGGYCAWAMAEGYTAPIDPAAWRIVEGRLYLNYSPRVQRRWEGDIPGNIARADANWPAVAMP
jgi:hypothetical protein